MTPQEFRQWRDTLKLSKKSAARLLDISATTLDQYETGIRRGTGATFNIPHVVALACAAILYGLKPYGAPPITPGEAQPEDPV